MGGGSIKKPTQKRSINFTTETLETLDKLAAKNHTTTSELVRGYVEKGLSIEGSREEIDLIARIIRQEIEDDFDQMLSEAVKLGVDYMQKKDFQINSFLQDTANLRELAEKL